jgi:phosphoribosylanthranilate isomerase
LDAGSGGASGARGGTGEKCDWGVADAVGDMAPIVLAGGLSCDNLREALGRVGPAAVDVSSGVESSPGVKDVLKVRQFIAIAKAGV